RRSDAMTRAALVAAAAVMLAGCATGNSYCLGDQPYSKAQSVTPIKTVEGLKLPETGSTLKVPPLPATAVPFGQETKDEKGKKVIECLDQPPRMPPSTDDKPDAAKPAG